MIAGCDYKTRPEPLEWLVSLASAAHPVATPELLAHLEPAPTLLVTLGAVPREAADGRLTGGDKRKIDTPRPRLAAEHP